MKNAILTLILMSFTLMAHAQEQYARVKIDLTQVDIAKVAKLGLECDHGHYVPHRHLINDFSYTELAHLDAEGIPYEILQSNAQQWYAHRLLKKVDHSHSLNTEVRELTCGAVTTAVETFAQPQNYEQGSMGGYLTYTELLATLDKMHEMYPHLITAKAVIDTFKTYEGRPIHYVSISDNPENNDEGEPAILYDALHHAREAASLSQLVFYMWYLLENYETDERVKYLVDNTHMYFIPCLNPDGYVYNETTMPNGGGLWRKNRFLSADGQHGIDLNRNYGYNWGQDDEGSSPVTNSDTYRGTGPFSEAETQAIRKFLTDHKVDIALNNHSYSNLLIRPKMDAGDELTVYNGFGDVLTADNGYRFGDDLTTVGYAVNGDSDSWMFYERSVKEKIYAMTPEVGPGSSGFWPSQQDLPAIHQSMMQLNLTAPNLLHNYVEYTDINASFFTQLTGDIFLEARQYGLRPENTTITVSAVTDNISFEDGAKQIDLALSEKAEMRWAYEIAASDASEEEVKFSVAISNTDGSGFSRIDTITKTVYFGEMASPLVDAANDLSGWTASTWGIDNSTFVSAPSCISDSPGGNYADNTTAELLRMGSIDLQETNVAILEFMAKWDIERNYDYVQVLAREEGTTEWKALCGQYTRDGTIDQQEGQPVYDGVQEDWVREAIPLTDYLGKRIELRFILVSDAFANRDGFFMDDLRIITYSGTPSATVDNNLNAALTLSPNPVSDRLNIQLEQKTPNASTRISLYNAQGHAIRTERLQRTAKGLHAITWDVQDLPTGLYFVRLDDSKGGVQTETFVKR